MNTRMVNENFISTLTYIGKYCKDLSGLEKEKEAIAIREIESIGVGVAAEAQKVLDAFSKTEQHLLVEILPFPVMRAQDTIVAANMALKKKVAVFKPEEEEAGLWRKGEKANREVAAYLLDLPKDRQGDGFGGVPATTMVRCMDFKGDREKRWTKGSFQQFIPNQKWYVDGERSYAIFSIQDFQKMTLLDIRYGNTDRNMNNILNKDGKLIPIDHGDCFPKEFHRYRLDWTIWKMAEIPYLPEMVEYVKTLDVDKDLEILRKNGIELGDEAIFVFRVQHMVLKLGVLGGNVPKDIGHLLTNPLSGGTSESLATLFHKCTTRNPTGVTLMESLQDSIKGVLQWVRDLRAEKESMTQRESMSMLSREEKKTETKPRESIFRQERRRLHKEESSTRKQETIATREIKSIGVGVTAEAQKIFDAFSKTLPAVQWVNKDILVSGEVCICSPYHDNCGTTTARDQIKAVLKQVRQELQLGTGGN